MGGFPSQEKRPNSATSNTKEKEVVEQPKSEDAGQSAAVPTTVNYVPESDLEKRVVATLKKLNKERLSKETGNRSVMNKVLLNFPKMQATFTDLHGLYMATDTDNSGSLDIDEVHELMHKLNPGIDKNTTLQIFLQSDVYTDGQINFKEFLTCLALGYLLDLIPGLAKSDEAPKNNPPLGAKTSKSPGSQSAAALGSGKVDEGASSSPDATQSSLESSSAAVPCENNTNATTTTEDNPSEKAGNENDAGESQVPEAAATASEEVPAVTETPDQAAEQKSEEPQKPEDSSAAEEAPDLFNDKQGVRRVFELATEMYLAFDSSCTGTITFLEMERVINSSTGVSEMTKTTQEVRKRRNSLTASGKQSSSKRVIQSRPAASSPMTDLLSRDRWKELDWDSDGFITYQEFIFTFVKWVASLSNDRKLDSDEEEEDD